MNYHPNKDEWHRAMMNHEEPICPKCGKGRIICPQEKSNVHIILNAQISVDFM